MKVLNRLRPTTMTTPSKQPASSKARIAIAYIGAAFFLVASAVVVKYARHAQVSGEPMPNGRGGVMSFADGYKVAGLLFVFSLIYGFRARMLTNRKAA
jgi:hypothetical protein